MITAKEIESIGFYDMGVVKNKHLFTFNSCVNLILLENEIIIEEVTLNKNYNERLFKGVINNLEELDFLFKLLNMKK